MSRNNGVLGQLGFFDEPEIGDSECLPWMNYGAIDFMAATIPTDARVLELGGGRSTSWWLNRGNRVLTVETDKHWAKSIQEAHENNDKFEGVVFLQSVNSDTLGDSQGSFDVICIDHGGQRELVVDWAIRNLSPEGYIIFDNSDRTAYKRGIDELISSGLGYVSFFGLVPGLHYATETTVFSRAFPIPHNAGATRKSIDY
jgi:hypothetical protein